MDEAGAHPYIHLGNIIFPYIVPDGKSEAVIFVARLWFSISFNGIIYDTFKILKWIFEF
jgi:hypothetical protein